ncbi:ABC transporter ATP-binding protein [Streptomyces spongiicola]|uniref:ABC transporter ATP-binding protein n=1 Tax=Streptomyces spongiicola TaxID=1690221 RepID=A0ABN5KNB2_9ACTN|nr:ABC transporter ATP-binding protein [Streptomyces spongiicola]AWK11215.1 ABC transporter ATP-binding protein [Streptomyces spongiicola]
MSSSSPASSPGLRLEGITVTYPGHRSPVLDGLDLDVADGRLLALLGPSGCGKTTTVQVASGLLAPTSGAVHLRGTDVTRTPPEHRGAAVVFQQPMLLPHRTALDNVAFPARVRGRTRRAARTSALEHLRRVGLDALADRYPRQLSGGQAQRVALARALAAEPAVLLLDEPFSALDPGLRHTMRDLLATVQRELAVTTVLVTHDQSEAAAVADSVALLGHGRLLQQARPADLYARPASLAVARFLGCATALPGSVTPQGRFACPLGELELPGAVTHRGTGHLVIRPEAVRLDTGPDTVPAVVRSVRPEGPFTALVADTAAGPVHALLPPGPQPAAAEHVRLHLPVAHRWVVAG